MMPVGQALSSRERRDRRPLTVLRKLLVRRHNRLRRQQAIGLLPKILKVESKSSAAGSEEPAIMDSVDQVSKRLVPYSKYVTAVT